MHFSVCSIMAAVKGNCQHKRPSTGQGWPSPREPLRDGKITRNRGSGIISGVLRENLAVSQAVSRKLCGIPEFRCSAPTLLPGSRGPPHQFDWTWPSLAQRPRGDQRLAQSAPAPLVFILMAMLRHIVDHLCLLCCPVPLPWRRSSNSDKLLAISSPGSPCSCRFTDVYKYPMTVMLISPWAPGWPARLKD